MKNFLKLLFLPAFILLYTSCKKLDAPAVSANGTTVTLSSSSNTLSPTVADSNNVVVSFSWTDPKYATDSANFKYVLEIDTVGNNFASARTKIVTAKNATSLTGRELNAIMIGFGSTVGAPVNLDVRVASSYANNNEKYESNTIQISVTPFNDPSTLTSTVSDITLSLPDAANNAGTLNWTTSFAGYNGNITYSIEYDIAGGNFATLGGTIAGGVGILTKTLTQNELNETAINSGIVAGDVGTVEYRVKAETALGAISYSNVINIRIGSYVSILRFYVPGSYQTATGNGTDWTPSNAPQMIRDLRPGLLNNMYYIYIYLPAGTAFKVTQGADWAINYGVGATPGTLELNSSTNLSVVNAGFYRISINRSTLEYNIMEGRMGFVGGATGAGWSPPDVFPNYALGNSGTNLFVGLTNLNVDGWKLIDNNAWNSGSNAVDESRSYGTPLASGSTLEVNGGNFNAVPSAGVYRLIWDGRDVDNVKYQLMDGSIMKLVGDGITGVPAWTPLSSPTMTYIGNNKWTITAALEANKDIKFLAGADWGAFDYEDASGGLNTLGVARKISFDGGTANFKTPATAGTYTITLDEGAQTVTIN